MKNTIKYLLLAIISIFIVGCASKNKVPRPSDTNPSGGSMYNGDVILNSGDSAYPSSLDAEGLKSRGAGEGSYSNANAMASIFFEFDQATISRSEEREKLTSIAAQLKANPAMKVVAEGHCDWRGTVEYNMSLGERRANAVLRYLKTLDITEDRIQTVSKGDLNAVVEGSAEQMNNDRRVDIIPVN